LVGEVFRELMGGLQKFGICPADGAVASAPGDGDFAGWARVGLEIFEEGLAGHGGFSVAYSWTVWEWRWDTIAGFGSLRGGRRGERGAKSRRDAGVTELQPQCDPNAESGMTTQNGKKT
jgi:hypothetical protein